MLILGVVGSFDMQYERNWKDIFWGESHDSAAILLDDGKVVCAIEEERLNRMKHTDKFPVSAIRFCLDTYGVTLNDIDKIAFYGEEKYHNLNNRLHYLEDPQRIGMIEPRTIIRKAIQTAVGCDFDENKLIFVPHHLAHAMSAFLMSGFNNSLILTIDGAGDDISGMVMNADRFSWNPLITYSIPNSLGAFYLLVIKYLGYEQHDEYKVMGLAPYGDPQKYQHIFKKFYTLLPDGKYVINPGYTNLLFNIMKPRRKGEPFTQVHQDIAASLQQSLEEIIFHILKYYKMKTNHTNLCLAGGVAHNCSVNGKILYSGMFDRIFVQPAAHDAGCAIGAALYLYYKDKPQVPADKLEHVYWGTHIGDNDHILKTLEKWRDYIAYEKSPNIVEKTAQYLADRAVIGWVQGRSEFGPRALGNRSIIADPRPVENKEIINAMVKKREGYRPFAPSVLEEYVDDYYETTPEMKQFPFMNFVFNVHKDQQKLLGAVTHVDGTARIQTVSKKTNKIYWELIDEFRKITGVPILLNTSFNNNAEPIVDNAQDAIVCYLTTKLDYLVIGDYFIKRRATTPAVYLNMILTIPVHVVLTETDKFDSFDKRISIYEISSNDDDNHRHTMEVSMDTYRILEQADNRKTLGALLKNTVAEEKANLIIDEILKLWAMRFVSIEPAEN